MRLANKIHLRSISLLGVCLVTLLFPFFSVYRVIDDVQAFAHVLLPMELLSFLSGFCLILAVPQRRLHPLTVLPALILLGIAALLWRIPADLLQVSASGYTVGSREGLGSLRLEPDHSPLVYLFLLDDHPTLYGLLSSLLLGLVGAAFLVGLLAQERSCFAWQTTLVLLGLACAALLADGLCAWAATRAYEGNWFGDLKSTDSERLQLYARLQLAAAAATPLMALGIGLLATRLPVPRAARWALSAACLALTLLGTGLFVLPLYADPFHPTRQLPNLSLLLPAEVSMAFSFRWGPLLFGVVPAFRTLPMLLLGALWAPRGRA